MRSRGCIRLILLGTALLALGPGMPSSLFAQDDLGRATRADAARSMIVLAVQLGIDSLPPTSGQSLSWHFEPGVEAPVANKHLGPTVLRTADTVGENNASIRLATSYFELSEEFGPIDYLVSGPFDPQGGRTRLGLDAQAKATLLSLAANYGLTRTIELDINLPIVVTHVGASEVFLADKGSNSVLEEELDPPNLIDQDLLGGSVVLQRQPYSALGVDFPDGTHAGIGRISVGGKVAVYSDDRFGIALAPEFFFPSPNTNEFAGPDTAAILGRAIARATLMEPLSLYLDTGYEYDFQQDELRRFTWTSGLSWAFDRATVDLGVGGSRFNSGITWTPSVAHFVGLNGLPGTVTALGDNRLGNTFVDFVGGLKVRLTDRVVLSGAVTVPVNDEGFRPAAAGTLALEYYIEAE